MENDLLKKFYFSQDYFFDLEETDCSKKLIQDIQECSFEQLFDFIKYHESDIRSLTSLNIPQFSNLQVIDKVLEVVSASEHLNYELIGYYLNKDTTVVAQRKYGENHYKLVALMGLATLDGQLKITSIGREYVSLPEFEKKTIRDKLFLRIPTIQLFLIKAAKGKICGNDLLSPILKESTINRRRTNINKIIACVIEHFPREERLLIENNIMWK